MNAHGTVFRSLPLKHVHSRIDPTFTCAYVHEQPSAAVKQVLVRTAVPNAPHVSVQLMRGPQSDQMPPVGQHLVDDNAAVHVPSEGGVY